MLKNKFGRYIAVVVISRGIAFITISTLIETKVGATTCQIFFGTAIRSKSSSLTLSLVLCRKHEVELGRRCRLRRRVAGDPR